MLGNIGLLGVMVSLLVCFQSAGDGVHNSGLVALLWNVLRVRNSESFWVERFKGCLCPRHLEYFDLFAHPLTLVMTNLSGSCLFSEIRVRASRFECRGILGTESDLA